MELSLPGLIGAAVGVMVGLIDYGLVAMLIRRAMEKRSASGAPASGAGPISLDVLLKVVFVVNCLVFAGLGYWFGASIGG